MVSVLQTPRDFDAFPLWNDHASPQRQIAHGLDRMRHALGIAIVVRNGRGPPIGGTPKRTGMVVGQPVPRSPGIGRLREILDAGQSVSEFVAIGQRAPPELSNLGRFLRRTFRRRLGGFGSCLVSPPANGLAQKVRGAITIIVHDDLHLLRGDSRFTHDLSVHQEVSVANLQALAGKSHESLDGPFAGPVRIRDGEQRPSVVATRGRHRRG
jgi:hypothetical protein